MINPINFFDAELIENELWFSNINFNALMKMNIKTGKTEFVDTFPEIPNVQEYIHIRVIHYEKCLYFIPYKDTTIHIWNYQELKWERPITVNCTEIINAFLYNDEIWFFPSTFENSIVKLDLKSKKEIVLTELTLQINRANSKCFLLDISNISLYEDQILVSSYEGNTVVAIDCKTESIINMYSFDNVSIAGVKSKDQDHFWVWFTNSSDIYLVNIKKENIICIKTDVKFHYNRIPFSNIVNIDENQALVLPRHTDDILLVDTLRNETYSVKMPNAFERCKISPLIFFYRNLDDTVILFPCSGNALLVFDKKTLSVSQMFFDTDEGLSEYAEKVNRQIFENKFNSGVIKESDGWKEVLPDFLTLVCEKTPSFSTNDTVNIGANIHNDIIKILL